MAASDSFVSTTIWSRLSLFEKDLLEVGSPNCSSSIECESNFLNETYLKLEERNNCFLYAPKSLDNELKVIIS
jgi:hypothetical protein